MTEKHHAHRQSDRRQISLPAVVLGIVFLALCFSVQTRAPFTSSEVRFTDTSSQGLSIVPASCPSDPHVDGGCDPPSCSISVSPATIVKGQTSSLTWSSTRATRGNIRPTVGTVGRSGSVTISPVTTTTYIGTFTGPNGTGSCRRTITVTNNPPADPTITGPSAGLVDQSLTYTFTSTDPNSDTIRYAIDWDNNGTTDEFLPARGYVSSGAPRSFAHSWSSSGAKTFRARTQDSGGMYSGWTSKIVTISFSEPVALLTATPTAFREGDPPVTLEWTSSNATSCTGTNFSTGTGSPSSGDTAAVPTQTTTYTVVCTGSGGSATDSATVTYGANLPPTIPSISGATNGTEDIAYTFTFTATDPDSDTMRYGIDWNPSSGVDEWVPASVYVSSGESETASEIWTTPGTKMFRALAQDSRGAVSDWRTHTITIAPACTPTNVCGADGNVHNSCTNAIVLPACQFGCSAGVCLPTPDPAGQFRTTPGIVAPNGTVVVSWEVENAQSCTVTENNPTFVDTWSGVSGSYTSKPISQTTTYTIRCDSFDEDVAQDDFTATALVLITPTFQEN